MIWVALLLALLAALVAFEDIWHDSTKLKFLYLALAASALLLYVSPAMLLQLKPIAEQTLLNIFNQVELNVTNIEKTKTGQNQKNPNKDQRSLTGENQKHLQAVEFADHGPPRYTSVYPRRNFLPNYDDDIARFPLLAIVYDSLETGQWTAARDTFPKIFSAIKADRLRDNRVLLAHLTHLNGVTLLELGYPKFARKSLEDAQRQFLKVKVADEELVRLHIDIAIALVLEGFHNGQLPTSLLSALNNNASSNLQEIALYYQVKSLEHLTFGESRLASIAKRDGISYAKKLRDINPAAANRLLALFRQTRDILVADRAIYSELKSTPVATPRYTALRDRRKFIKNYDLVIVRYPAVKTAYDDLERGDWVRARQVLKSILNRFDDWSDENTELFFSPETHLLGAELNHLLGIAALEEGKFVEAINLFDYADYSHRLAGSSDTVRLGTRLDKVSAKFKLGQVRDLWPQNAEMILKQDFKGNMHDYVLLLRLRYLVDVHNHSHDTEYYIAEARALVQKIGKSDPVDAQRLTQLLNVTARSR
jgi:hypothetical protein